MALKATRLLLFRCLGHARVVEKDGRQQASETSKTVRTKSAKASVHVLLADLKSCSITRNLEFGRRIHAKVLETGTGSNVHVATALLNMYAKCGSMVDAHQVFDTIHQPSVVSWTALLSGYADNGQGLIALDLFSRMKSEGCAPNSVTYVAALKACTVVAQKQEGSGKQECLERGKRIHSEIGCHTDLYVQNILIDMYAKCGSMNEARKVFNNIKNPSVVSWNSLLLGYADIGEGLIALDLFSRMKSQGFTPDSRTYVAALKGCTSLVLKQDGMGRAKCLERAKQIHAEIGCYSNVYVQTAMVEMYAKCGSMADAHKVFDSIKQPSVVSWNSLLLGYAEIGEGLVTLDLFSRMKSQGCSPNSISYVAVLKACTSVTLMQDGSRRLECLERAKQFHTEVGCHLNLYVQTTLIDLYSKCGSMSEAHQVFDSIQTPSVASWTALLVGYAENGEGHVALDLFSRMKCQGCKPDSLTFVGVLKACSLLGALEIGRKVHAEVQQFDAILVTCLVDFYAKCGSLAEAQEVFDLHAERRDLRTWTALLAGYSSFGKTDSVFKLFDKMQDAGFQPDGVTCQCVLLCCSHAGLVDKARECFETMSAKYGVTPSVEHYTCMVDVLGRANKLDDAIVLLERMPCNPDPMTWMTVLGACRKWKNVEMGRLAFQSLISLDDMSAAAYVLMAHIYASRGMLEEQQMLLRMRNKSHDWIVLGQICWENDMREVHSHGLLVENSEHPQIQEIQEKMKHICEMMREHGYSADSLSNCQSVVDSTKDCGHNDNLAIACALINTESKLSHYEQARR